MVLLCERGKGLKAEWDTIKKQQTVSSRKKQENWLHKAQRRLPSLNSFLHQTSFLISEKAVAPHSSTLAWKIPWMEECGVLQSVGSQRVGHDWATSLSNFTFIHWRRKWQPTPVFLPGESQGQGSLVGHTESDTSEAT